MGITIVEVVSSGPQGIAGVSTVAGGTTGQVLAKISNVNYDVDWVDLDADDVAFTSTGDLTSTVSADAINEADANIGLYTELTGIVDIDDIVSLNANITKIDIAAFDYFIQGVRYSYAGATGVTPTIEAADSSTWISVDATGIVYGADKLTKIASQTTLAIARLQAVQGDSGPGSELQSPIHLVYPIGETGFVESDWVSNTIGALYVSGGTYSENSVNALQVDQAEGIFHTAQKKHIDIAQDNSIEASAFYHVSGASYVRDREVLTIPKFYDDGTDLVALDNDKYASHTLLRSPKEEDVFLFVYSNAQYISQDLAENATVDFALFIDQANSGFIPVARFIIKGDSTNIVSIMDERPSIINRNSSSHNVSNMQQVYNNSSTPEILTDSIRGALSVKRGTAADTDIVLEGLNGAGDTTFSVDGNGLMVGTQSVANILPANIVGDVTTLNNMEIMFNHLSSAGMMHGCGLTDNLDGTIDLAPGHGLLRDSTDDESTLWVIKTELQENLTMLAGVNYVSIDWNSGVPQFITSADRNSFNCQDICICYIVVRHTDNSLSWINAMEQNVDANRKTRRLFLQLSGGFIHLAGGTILANAGSLAVSVTAGKFNFMLEELSHAAFNTSIAGTDIANIFSLFYRDGGTSFTEIVDQKVVDTTKYDIGTGALGTLANNKFGVTWFYMIMNNPNHLVAMVGQEAYSTQAEAEAASAPSSVPDIVEGLGTLIGFVTYQESGTEFTAVLSAFTETLSASGASIHNSLAGIQGGEADDYQHLTTDQVTAVDNIGTENHMEIINLTGVDFPAGKAVRHNGVTGGNVKAVLALADTFQNATILGVTAAIIPDGETGLVTTFGPIENIDMDDHDVGVPLYLSDTVAGDFTATSPIIRTQIGGCIIKDDTVGKLFVTIVNNIPLPRTLGSLLDATTPTSISLDLVNGTPIANYTDSIEIVTEANETTGVLTAPLDGIYRINLSMHMLYDNVGQSGDQEFNLDLVDTTAASTVKTLGGFILDGTQTYSLTDNGAATLIGGHDYRLEIRSGIALTNFSFSSSTFYIESILY